MLNPILFVSYGEISKVGAPKMYPQGSAELKVLWQRTSCASMGSSGKLVSGSSSPIPKRNLTHTFHGRVGQVSAAGPL